jgi:hypothetical protein
VPDNILNRVALLHVSVQHAADEVDTLIAEGEGDAEIAVHDLVDAIEGILLIDDCVQENTECPNVLFLAAVGLAC